MDNEEVDVKCAEMPTTPEPPSSSSDDVDEVDSGPPVVVAATVVASPPTPPETRSVEPECGVSVPAVVELLADLTFEPVELEEKPEDEPDDDDDDDDEVPLETESLDPDPIVGDCKMCQKKFSSPRVLSCLHVFCEPCILDILVVEESGSGKYCAVTCPLCKQMMKLGNAGMSALQPDYVSTNIIDISSLDPQLLACTSCKSKETAISRCNDCANFLCASCDNAHQYMRCFENHKVVPLEEMRMSEERVAIHKPLFCRLHVTENLKYFCFNCQVPVCNDCLLCEHKGAEHNYEVIGDAEKRMRNEVEGLMREARTKFGFCEKTTSNLDSSLHELQSQHDAAQDAINETYQAFKVALDRCQEDALKELEKLHSERELKIMDLFHNVEKSAERIENACGFTQKVLEQANAPEFLSLKKMISSQFLNLIHTIPKAEINFTLKFVSNREKFEQTIGESFGKLCTEASPPSPKETTPPPTLPGMPPQLNKTTPHNGATGSVTASSPISLPTSMQSSFDGDMPTLHTNFIHHTPEPPSPAINQPPPNFHQQPPPLQGLTSIAEYNLHRLANLQPTADQMNVQSAPQPPPPLQQSNQSQFTIADLISGDPNAFNNLQALAKIGLPDLPRPSSILPDFPNPMVPPPSLLPFNENSDHFGSNNNQIIPGRTKATPMQIRCKFGSLGAAKGQFNAPHGFCLGLEEEIIVADTNNHRIQIFEKNGTFKFQFGVPGKDEGQLWYPRKVAVMRANSRFVVCDRGNERSRMQIFTKNGHFIKKIAIRYIDIVAGLAVTNNGHIVAVDSVSPTVFIISEEGELVHWFDCSDFMREPSDIAINGSDFYVCDFKGHCVAVFSDQGQFIMRIGSEKVTCFPNGIDISDAGDILIGDSHGNRFHVACYSREGVLQSEFECPHVKVSRCCGLKITSEGYVVTLAKNNHHVLVLNTLYIQ